MLALYIEDKTKFRKQDVSSPNNVVELILYKGGEENKKKEKRKKEKKKKKKNHLMQNFSRDTLHRFRKSSGCILSFSP